MAQPQITRQHFGNLRSGEAVDLYTLVNSHGACAQITDYGGIVVSLRVPDADLDQARHGEDPSQVVAIEVVARV